ncbi:MAG TPA: TIR domain-containing protein [Pyrinomonadaceae bacterium]|nr:TIR domain-containing protein [Pyrinomonadaceae bacterium]
MSFTDDIFISYAHIDDRPVDDVKGWVTTLHERLNDRLAQLVGTELQIWWDQREQANQYLIGMIGERISNTRLLVSIVTPRYLNSNWCRAEVAEFARRADQTGGITIGDQPRVFKVIKTPVNPQHDMDELRELLSFDFYEVDANGSAREFRQEVGANKDLKYWARFEDLAQAIKRAIESAQPERTETQPEDLPLARKVYLAQTTADLRDERDRIKRELLQRSFFVLPDHGLPTDTAAEFEAAVRAEIDRCVLSVHLIGESYGSIPDGEEERSVIRWQSDIAADKSQQDPNFVRLIWMPPGLQPKPGRHAKLLEDLRTSVSSGSELLETPIEDLKTRILEKLTPAAAAPTPAATSSGESDVTRVYLIHDNRDTDGVKPVDDFLYNEGFEVIRSINEGEQSQIAQYHRDNLCTCDAALIYYGNGSELWLRSKFWDLQKAPGWGRARPMKAKGVYVSAPVTPSKESFRTREVKFVMPNFGDFKPDTLRPFVQALKNGG